MQDLSLENVTTDDQLGGIEILVQPVAKAILTPAAIQFVATLHRALNPARLALLARREQRQAAIMNGDLPALLPETEQIRTGQWQVAAPPAELQKRWVEITGPVERKIMINALNSGADVFMADFEDSLSPTWQNVIAGQQNLVDAVRRTIHFTSDEGKEYRLNDRVATLMVRPRGWHLDEGHVLVDGSPISASLFDFGLYLFHNAAELQARGTGPYFYLPKLENHREARLWNQAFQLAQDLLGLPRGTIRATVLIETLLAAFEMEEILYELREHVLGLNAGRWDYLFSVIKTFRDTPGFVLPDRAQITMRLGGLPVKEGTPSLPVDSRNANGKSCRTPRAACPTPRLPSSWASVKTPSGTI